MRPILQRLRLAHGRYAFTGNRQNRRDPRQQLSDVKRVRAGEDHGQRDALYLREEGVFVPVLRRSVGSARFFPCKARTEVLSTIARVQSS